MSPNEYHVGQIRSTLIFVVKKCYMSTCDWLEPIKRWYENWIEVETCPTRSECTVSLTELNLYIAHQCERAHPSQAKFANPYNGAPTPRAALGIHKNLNPALNGHMEAGWKPPQRHLWAFKSKGHGPLTSPMKSLYPKASTGFEMAMAPLYTWNQKCPRNARSSSSSRLGVQIMLWSYVSDKLNNIMVGGRQLSWTNVPLIHPT